MNYMLNDKTLQSLSQGDRQAFDEIFNRCAPTIYKVALQYFKHQALAREFVTEIFAGVWNERSTFANAEHLAVYLNTSARKLTIPYLIKAIEADATSKLRREDGKEKY